MSFLAILKAIIEIPTAIRELVAVVQSLRNEEIERQLTQFKLEVRQTVKDIENAKTAEDRRRLSAELANRVAR